MNRRFDAFRHPLLGERFFVVISIGVALAAGTGRADAQSLDGREVVVHTADLDLTTARGVARLNARINRAAYRVCDRGGPADARSWAAVRQCAWRVAHTYREQVRDRLLRGPT